MPWYVNPDWNRPPRYCYAFLNGFNCVVKTSLQYGYINNVLVLDVFDLFSFLIISVSFPHDNYYSLPWRHNGRDGVSNHQPHDYFYRLFRRRSKKTSKLRVTGLCAGNSPVTGEFPDKWPVTQKMFPFDDVIMYWDVYIHDHTFWTMDFGFLKLDSFGSAIAHPPRGVSVPGASFRILDWTHYHRNRLCQMCIFKQDILQERPRLCNWLSFWSLVSWVSH